MKLTVHSAFLRDDIYKYNSNHAENDEKYFVGLKDKIERELRSKGWNVLQLTIEIDLNERNNNEVDCETTVEIENERWVKKGRRE